MVDPLHRRITAWMGGTRPAPLSAISTEERTLVSSIFRRNVKLNAEHWASGVSLPLARTFWKCARYDAHATLREGT